MKRREVDDEVPRLPRGKGLALSGPMMMRIGMTAVALVAIVVLQRPCSSAIGRFVTSFGEGSAGPGPGEVAAPGAEVAAPAPPSGAAAVGTPAAGTAPADLSQYEVLTPSMTDDELRAAIERAERRAKAARDARAVKDGAPAASAPAAAPAASAPAPTPAPAPP